jgi:hypothetical protein
LTCWKNAISELNGLKNFKQKVQALLSIEKEEECLEKIEKYASPSERVTFF